MESATFSGTAGPLLMAALLLFAVALVAETAAGFALWSWFLVSAEHSVTSSTKTTDLEGLVSSVEGITAAAARVETTAADLLMAVGLAVVTMLGLLLFNLTMTDCGDGRSDMCELLLWCFEGSFAAPSGKDVNSGTLLVFEWLLVPFADAVSVWVDFSSSFTFFTSISGWNKSKMYFVNVESLWWKI